MLTTNFRSTDFTTVLWDPRTNGMRYLKALIYSMAMNMNQRQWDMLVSIKKRHLGKPVSIRFNGELVCLDYIEAVLELEFLRDHLCREHLPGAPPLDILEIGAGYGRTCHALFSNIPVSSYCIVELPERLGLASEYLGRVLDRESYSKISFLSPGETSRLTRMKPFDLCLNICCFGVMKIPAVKRYLEYIDRCCRFLYVKNPVGDYSASQGVTDKEITGSGGILKEIIDIHDNLSIRHQFPKFIEAYRPTSSWLCTADGWAPPWSYYWQALYKKMPSREPR